MARALDGECTADMAAAVQQHHNNPHVEQDRKVDRMGTVARGVHTRVWEQRLGKGGHTDLGRNLLVEH
jgi:hypothetical protein